MSVQAASSVGVLSGLWVHLSMKEQMGVYVQRHGPWFAADDT